jgi:hypothetical protein
MVCCISDCSLVSFGLFLSLTIEFGNVSLYDISEIQSTVLSFIIIPHFQFGIRQCPLIFDCLALQFSNFLICMALLFLGVVFGLGDLGYGTSTVD